MKGLPGRTDTFGDPCASLMPFGGALSAIPPVKDRWIVLLATATITESNLYANGLFQNVFVLYRMFDAMGYAPILIVNAKPTTLEDIPGPLRACRTIVTEDLLRQPMQNLAAMIEIGMSMDVYVREFVKMSGGKLIKLYLGNILNIDIETPLFYPTHNFAHHVVGKVDEILVSPHYGQHAEYAAHINHVVPKAGVDGRPDLEALIGPYVWDPSILTRNGTQNLAWRPAAGPEEEVFVVMEPNISFQKSSIVPLLGLERWYRAGKAAGRNWKGKVVVINGDRLSFVPHFVENVKPYLELFADDRVDLQERNDVVSVMREFPAATFVLHNVNNEFNYMTLELLWAGFPVVHNAPSWAPFGYSYAGSNLEELSVQAEAARSKHAERQETYRAHAQMVAWRHSPYNPDVQAVWEKILKRE